MESSTPFGIFVTTESNDLSSDQLNEGLWDLLPVSLYVIQFCILLPTDQLKSNLKIILTVITCTILVMVIYFPLLYYCRRYIKIARDADAPSFHRTPHPAEQGPSASVMIFNSENDISGYWNTEVNVDNECVSVYVPESVQVVIDKTEAFVELNNRKRHFFIFKYRLK